MSSEPMCIREEKGTSVLSAKLRKRWALSLQCENHKNSSGDISDAEWSGLTVRVGEKLENVFDRIFIIFIYM